MSKEWLNVKLPSALVNEIDGVVAKSRIFGISRYNSRADFAKEACIALLQSEKNRVKSSSSNAKMEAIAK